MKDKIVLVCGRFDAEDRHRTIGYGPESLVSMDPTVRQDFRRSIRGDESRKTCGSLPMVSAVDRRRKNDIMSADKN